MGVVCSVHLTPRGFLFVFSLSLSLDDFLLCLITMRILSSFFPSLSGLTSIHQVLSTVWSLELGMMYLSFTIYKKRDVAW